MKKCIDVHKLPKKRKKFLADTVRRIVGHILTADGLMCDIQSCREFDRLPRFQSDEQEKYQELAGACESPKELTDDQCLDVIQDLVNDAFESEGEPDAT